MSRQLKDTKNSFWQLKAVLPREMSHLPIQPQALTCLLFHQRPTHLQLTFSLIRMGSNFLKQETWLEMMNSSIDWKELQPSLTKSIKPRQISWRWLNIEEFGRCLLGKTFMAIAIFETPLLPSMTTCLDSTRLLRLPKERDLRWPNSPRKQPNQGQSLYLFLVSLLTRFNRIKDVYIALMGAVGCGKSSFINLVCGKEVAKVSHTLSRGKSPSI